MAMLLKHVIVITLKGTTAVYNATVFRCMWALEGKKKKNCFDMKQLVTAPSYPADFPILKRYDSIANLLCLSEEQKS